MPAPMTAPATRARLLAPLLFVLLTGLAVAGCHGRLPRPGKPVAPATTARLTAPPPGALQRQIGLGAGAKLLLT